VPQDDPVNKTAIALALVSLPALLSGCGGGDTKAAATTDTTATGPDTSASAKVSAAPTSSMSPADSEKLAIADVTQVAPALEAYFRVHGYPTDLEKVFESMGPAGLFMDQSDALASYTYRPSDKEFVLCVQNDSNAWASYDTAPMAVVKHGQSGGCPQS
jgi:hypothetical protein